MNITPLKVKRFLIYLLVYTALVVVYFLVILRFLGKLLENTFHENLVVYTVLVLVLIIGQGVFLEYVTSFIIDRFSDT